MVRSSDVWRSSRFRSQLQKRGLSLADLWRELGRRLGEDAPCRSTVFKWADPESGGPQRRAWRSVLAEVLKERRGSRVA